MLGVMYLSSLLVARDESVGHRWLSLAAEAGGEGGKRLLAWSAGGAETAAQIRKLRDNAENHDKAAECALGLAYLCGTGVERDTKLARKLLQRSSDDGEPMASKLLQLLAHSSG
jgi:TPR repeat protein